MTKLKRKNPLFVIFFYSTLIIISLLNSSPVRANMMDNVKYLISFKTTRSACMVRVNGFPVFDNLTYTSGTISAGDNITSFIENGKNNIEILMGSIDSADKNTLYSDSACEIKITKDTVNSSETITIFRLSVDPNKKIVASSSSHYDGLEHEGPIIEEQLPQDKALYLHRFYRQVKFSGIPEWSWVNADRVVIEEDIPNIKEKYHQIWIAIKNRNLNKLKEMTEISNREMGFAEGVSSDAIFESYDLPRKVLDENLSPINLEWSKYNLVTYCGGRVFRMANSIYQNSPLKFKDKNNELVFSYNPYLSIINGKIVIVR